MQHGWVYETPASVSQENEKVRVTLSLLMAAASNAALDMLLQTHQHAQANAHISKQCTSATPEKTNLNTKHALALSSFLASTWLFVLLLSFISCYSLFFSRLLSDSLKHRWSFSSESHVMSNMQLRAHQQLPETIKMTKMKHWLNLSHC